jgi:hypothetical protein
MSQAVRTTCDHCQAAILTEGMDERWNVSFRAGTCPIDLCEMCRNHLTVSFAYDLAIRIAQAADAAAARNTGPG